MEEKDMNSVDLFSEIGGIDGISLLVDAFYARVQQRPELIPLFQNSDFEEVKRKQTMFLTQFVGGPSLYSNEFGHPMMRYRHMPFEITPARAKAWLYCMQDAMQDVGFHGNARDYLFGRLVQVAQHMVNSYDQETDEE